MLLPDYEIKRLAVSHKMIEPFEEGVKRPGTISYGLTSYGYDVRLAPKFKLASYKTDAAGVGYTPWSTINPKNIDPVIFRDVEAAPIIQGTGYDKIVHGNGVVIPPHGFVLGETVERIRVPRHVSVTCLGKSTYARCGLIVNVTPLEPEWEGTVTIEISNTTDYPAIVYANEGIAQLQFHRNDVPCTVSYADKNGKYQNQFGVTLPRVD